MKPAAGALVVEHVRLVHWVAKQNRQELSGEYDDLVGDGMVGLVQAANRYDSTNPTPFRLYARSRILGEMIDGSRRRSNYDRYKKCGRLKPTSLDELVDGGNYEPTATCHSVEDLVVSLDEADRLTAYMDSLPGRLPAIARALRSGRSLEDLAVESGVSPSRLSQQRHVLKTRVSRIVQPVA